MGTCFDMDAILERATKHQDTTVHSVQYTRASRHVILFQYPSCHRLGRHANPLHYRSLCCAGKIGPCESVMVYTI